MASVWIRTRPTAAGGKRYRVEYRLGGRESKSRYGGSFETLREAKLRKAWIAGELANMRVPDLAFTTVAEPETLRTLAARWQMSRVDVSKGTEQTYRVNLGRILSRLGDTAVDRIDAQAVAGLVAELHAEGLKKETIRKTLSTFAQVLDFGRVQPNPVRDRTVKLPHEETEELTPPAAPHVEAVFELLPSEYRLPLLVLDATGMRISELELLQWGDVDEPDLRWRVRRAATKTRRPRWVPFVEFPLGPIEAFAAVATLVPREDRDLRSQVFAGFDGDAFRTSLARACKAAAVPLFSPNDLRHRRATLWHLGGVPAAQAAAWLGHSPQEHLRTYAHATLADRSELNYPNLLARVRPVLFPVLSSDLEKPG
jgi:integrase